MNSELWYELPPDMSMWNNAVLENIARKSPIFLVLLVRLPGQELILPQAMQKV